MLCQRFDITVPAPNGLRRGRTTGTCAAAAVKAAVLSMHGTIVTEVDITLPGDQFSLIVPVHSVTHLPDGVIRVEVIKEAGDDPDATDGATIFCMLKPNDTGRLRLLAGDGVGVVTQPGIRVPIGEPAINPVPRQMIAKAIEEAFGIEDAR